MKKALSLIICVFLLCTFFAGCKEESGNTASGGVDVEYYAKLGQMPECEYSLGADVKQVNDACEKYFEENEESYYSRVEGENSILIDAGAFKYYYEKEKEEKGISLIVNNNTAFGFELGTVSIEIEEALSGFRYEAVKDIENELFFMMGSFENISGIKYTFGENAVIFVFNDNALIATAIYSLENWTL